jgi:hypothetical protein
MAYTVSKHPTVFGNKAAVGLEITADDATQTIETGLKRIDWMQISYNSMTTLVGLNVAYNSHASGVESFGVLGLSGFASGDKFCVTVYGVR